MELKSKIPKIFLTFVTTKNFYLFSEKCIPLVAILFTLFVCLGLYGGLILARPDYQQGELFRIIYIHVPAAFLSLFVYMVMFLCSVIFLIWRVKLVDLLAQVSCGLGASFTFLALFTGALWGKPMWGTFWVWDARLTSELILLFIYFGYMGLAQAIPSEKTRGKTCALFAIVGMVDVPIVHFSVHWWNTLHQGSTLSKLSPSIAGEMLMPLLCMIVAFVLFYMLLVFYRMQTAIILRDQKTQWLSDKFLERAHVAHF